MSPLVSLPENIKERGAHTYLAWKMWPRACAMAETLWTGTEKKDFGEFLKRMETHRRRLIGMGVNCAPLR